MSGSLASIPLATKGVDPYATMAEIADVSAKQGQAGVLGQQARAAEIQNYLAGLKANAIAPLFGGAPMGGNALAGLSAPGPSSGGQPGAAPAALPAGYSMTGSPYGAVMTPYGVALPQLQVGLAWASNDPTKAMGDLLKQRAVVLNQLLAPVSNADEYNAALGKAYGAGMVAPDDYARHFQTASTPPDQWQNYRRMILQSTQDPDAFAKNLLEGQIHGFQPNAATGAPEPATGANAGQAALEYAKTGGAHAAALPYAGPTAQAEAAGKAVGSGALVDIKIRNADGSETVIQKPADQANAFVKANQGATIEPGAAGMKGAFTNAIFGQESGSGADTRTSVSGARGFGQLMPATFAQYAKPGEKIDNRDDNIAVAQRAIDDLWQKSGGDPMRTAVGYFSGPGNIAPPGSPNPWREDRADANGVKTSDYVRQVMTRMLNPPAGGGGAAPGGAVGVGVPKLSPQATAGLDLTKGFVADDKKDVDAALTMANNGQRAQADLFQIRDLIPGVTTGSWASDRQAVQNYLSTFAPKAAQDFAKAISAGVIDPSKTNATQEFVKLTLKQAGLAEREALGARGGYSAITLYQKAFPNIEMQPKAISDMTNLMLVAHQRDIDYGQGANAFYNNNANAAVADPRKYTRLQNFDGQFLQSNPPEVYVGAAALLNHQPYGEWWNRMTPAQHQEAIRIVWRADPGAVIVTNDNPPRLAHNPALAAQ